MTPILIPTPLRAYTAKRDTVHVAGTTIGEALAALTIEFGDLRQHLFTADGKLRTCLFSLHETDLRGPLRDGASDDELVDLIRDAVWRKELKHRIGEPGFRQPQRTMSQIGG